MPVDQFTMQVIAYVRHLMKERKLGRTELAERMGMRANNLGRYFNPGRNGYGSIRAEMIMRFAKAFDMTFEQFMEGMMQRVPGMIWDPTSQTASDLVAVCQRHEEGAREGVGFFREFACPVLVPEIRRQVNLYWFAGLGSFGEHMTQAYDDVADFYAAEYDRRGGDWGEYKVTSLMLCSDVRRFVRGEDEYSGCTPAIRQDCLERLRAHHVFKLGYRIGFIEDEKVAPSILYDLVDANSLIAIGSTLTLRRQMRTFKINLVKEGERLNKDLRELNKLKSLVCHELSPQGIARQIERFQREAEKAKPFADSPPSDRKKGSRVLDFLKEQ